MKRKPRHLTLERLADRRMLAGDIVQVGHFNTWDGGIIRSTDIAGITFHPPSGHLYLADSEINEISNIFTGDNIFETSLTGDQVFREITSNNTEPTGITYSEFDGYFYVTNDTGARLITRYDNNLDTPLLQVSSRTALSTANDPEGISSNPLTGDLYVADGSGGGRQVLVYDANLQFKYHFSVAGQMNDAEGIAFHAPSSHLFLVDGSQDMVFEYTLDGVFLESYDLNGFQPAPKSPQGLTFGPTSDPLDDPSNVSLYIADGMRDNYPDGQVFEAVIGNLAPPGNHPPTTTGISDVNVNVGAANTIVDLFAAFDDFEDADSALTYTLQNNSNPALFSATAIDGVAGTLTLGYAPGTPGTAQITVRATDTGTPPLFVESTFNVSVAPVNQPPTTSGIANVAVAEDDANTVIDLFAAFHDPEDPDPSLQYTLQANTNAALFTATAIDGALGHLTLDYAPDATGTALITVRATDNGFPALFVESTFAVTLSEVNDVPRRTSGLMNNLTVVQNSPATPLGLTGLTYGPGGGADENGQTLSYSVTAIPASTLGTIVLADGITPVIPGAYSLAQIQGMQFQPAANIFGGPETFAFRVTDDGTTSGTADFKSLDQSLLINVIEYIPNPIAIDVQVAASSDDAEERPSGSVNLTSSDLELTQDGTNQQVVGMRFAGLNIPPGATIQNAYIQFQVDQATSGATSLMIYGQAVDNAATFTTTSHDITTRSKTTAAVPWVPATWTAAGQAGLAQQTGNIATVIQEIVRRPGWASGNALAIIINGTGNRTAESYDGVAAAAPRLHVEYLPGNLTPTTTGISDVNVNVGAANTIVDLFAAFDDFEDADSALTYTLQNNSNPALFSATAIDGVAGTLTLGYAPGTPGTAQITVRATDTGTPPLFVESTFNVSVAPVNQPPTTSGIANVAVAEDDANTVIDLFAAFHDPEDPDPSLQYTLQANTNAALFTATAIDGALGHLTLDYAPDATGTALITVRATDNGFPALFVESTFAVTLSEVNDVPRRTSGLMNNLTVVQNSPATPLGLTGLTYGPGGGADENGQTLSYSVTAIPASTLGTIVLADGITPVIPGAYSLAQIQGMQFQPAANIFGGPETFAFRVTDDGTTSGTADFKSLDQSLLINVIEYIPNPIAIDVQVAASSDDAEERPSGNVNLTSSDLELTQDKSNQQVVGMRFAGLNIPPGATIQNAYIQFQAKKATSGATSLMIYGQAADNAATFANSSHDITTRSKTTAAVPWVPAAWTVTGQQTGNIAAVIQEIVRRPGWASGNALAIIINGTGDRIAQSYDGVAAAAPRLHVEYLPGSVSPTAVNDVDSTLSDTPVVSFVLQNDILGTPPTTVSSVTQGTNGSVTFDSAAGTTTYTPNASFIGTDRYSYTITDANSQSSSANVDVTVLDATAPLALDFRVLGDVPYGQSEYSELEADLGSVAPSDAFFVHLGDIKADGTACDEPVYSSVSASLQTSSIPVFIVPGDNEWNDCSNPTQAWSYWDLHLMRLEDHWSHGFNVSRQSVRPENFSFVQSGVLFIGLNLVGGSVHDQNEWSQRMVDDAAWVNQNFSNFGNQVTSAVVFGHSFPDPTGGDRQAFAQEFVVSAQSFAKPILYMMGDDHQWQLDHPYASAPNVTRVTVDQGVPSVRVTATHDPNNPFSFDQTPTSLLVQATVPAGSNAVPLQESQLEATLESAIARLSPFLSQEALSRLGGLTATIVDLPGDVLGSTAANSIRIDIDAGGYGWFVDSTPGDNREFVYDSATDQYLALSGEPANERVDLLTVVLHELGHLLGSEHTESNGWMDPTLPLGTRRLPNHTSETSSGLSVSQVDRFFELLDA